MKKFVIAGVVSLSLILVLFFTINVPVESSTNIDSMELSYPKDAKAEEVTLELTNDENNFLINGEKVAEEIRVPVDTLLNVNVINNTKYETSLHFHGIRGLSKMDGVGGMTQNNIKPGEDFTYEFYLDTPGTYMYHSHVDSENQVNDELLFGGVIVEDENQQNYNNKFTYIFNSSDSQMNPTLTFNGENTQNIELNNDEDIYINLINLSSNPMTIFFGDDVQFQVIGVDANEVESEVQKNKQLYFPTANRADIIIKNPKKSFKVQSTLNGNKNAEINFKYNSQEPDINENLEPKEIEGGYDFYDNKDYVYLYNIINMQKDLDLGQPDKEFDMELDMGNVQGEMKWTINEQAYPNTDEVVVEEGDTVKINLSAPSSMHTEPHPFHLHGHEFQLESVDGQEVNKNLVMDTLEVIPGHQYTIKLKANNPGVWAFHCHNLSHAELGMMTTLRYKGYYFE